MGPSFILMLAQSDACAATLEISGHSKFFSDSSITGCGGVTQGDLSVMLFTYPNGHPESEGSSTVLQPLMPPWRVHSIIS